MFIKFIETLFWGVASSISAVVISIIFDFNNYTARNIIISAFILGCIRGYTGKDIIALLL